MMKRIIITFLGVLSVISVNAQNDRTSILQDLEKNQPTVRETTLTATLKSASRLFGDKNDLTSVILIIPSGSVVDVLDSDSTYLHVAFEEDEGYIFKRHAVIDETTVSSIPAVKAVEPVRDFQETQAAPEQEVSRFTFLENKYGTRMASRLITGKIWKGMSSEMVSDSWGSPIKINRVISGNTIKEEWIYKNTWLFIKDDYLVEWGPVKN
ncbi:MAG: hypothetical protein MUC93_09895 [Bacteroidales bacterium]|jgi:hypothetical protein|nr:hypothetical protein [Bacteroidales bacterium]